MFDGQVESEIYLVVISIISCTFSHTQGIDKIKQRIALTGAKREINYCFQNDGIQSVGKNVNFHFRTKLTSRVKISR